MKTVIITKSADDTENLGFRLGQALKGGEVIELVNDLGGGKTTFTRGLAKGVGSQDHVSSPTFTISNIYEADKLTIHHFDFYRLAEAGLMEHELQDVLGQDDQVVVVEWSDVVAHVLPEDRLTIRFASDGEDQRTCSLEYPDRLKYLVAKL